MVEAPGFDEEVLEFDHIMNRVALFDGHSQH